MNEPAWPNHATSKELWLRTFLIAMSFLENSLSVRDLLVKYDRCLQVSTNICLSM
jgi:hypothetical protein